MCKEKTTNKFYIGYRYNNTLPSTEDLGKKYFTSNDYVRNNFDNFEYQIIAEFFNKKDALDFEGLLIRETRSENQINYEKHSKLKGTRYKMPEYDTSPKKCAIPDCEKIVTDWRKKCCCKSHSAQYSAKVRYGTLDKPSKTPEEIKKYQKEYYQKKLKA